MSDEREQRIGLAGAARAWAGVAFVARPAGRLTAGLATWRRAAKLLAPGLATAPAALVRRNLQPAVAVAAELMAAGRDAAARSARRASLAAVPRSSRSSRYMIASISRRLVEASTRHSGARLPLVRRLVPLRRSGLPGQPKAKDGAPVERGERVSFLVGVRPRMIVSPAASGAARARSAPSAIASALGKAAGRAGLPPSTRRGAGPRIGALPATPAAPVRRLFAARSMAPVMRVTDNPACDTAAEPVASPQSSRPVPQHDMRRLAELVTESISRAANRPPLGYSGVDDRLTPVFAGMVGVL